MDTKGLMGKISSYNLFTNLLPGVLYVVIAKEITRFNLIVEPVFVGLFLYYFIGVVINRIGSLVIEPFLRWIKQVRFIDYEKFVRASKLDGKIEVISETNNMYRSLLTLSVVLLLTMGYDRLIGKWECVDNYTCLIVIVLLICFFCFHIRNRQNMSWNVAKRTSQIMATGISLGSECSS